MTTQKMVFLYSPRVHQHPNRWRKKRTQPPPLFNTTPVVICNFSTLLQLRATNSNLLNCRPVAPQSCTNLQRILQNFERQTLPLHNHTPVPDSSLSVAATFSVDKLRILPSHIKTSEREQAAAPLPASRHQHSLNSNNSLFPISFCVFQSITHEFFSSPIFQPYLMPW